MSTGRRRLHFVELRLVLLLELLGVLLLMVGVRLVLLLRLLHLMLLQLLVRVGVLARLLLLLVLQLLQLVVLHGLLVEPGVCVATVLTRPALQ